MSKFLLPFFIILVSAIYGMGNIRLYFANNRNLDLLNLTQTSRITRDEIFAYAPEVKYILNGNLLLGEIYTHEYQDYPTPFLGETFPALIFSFLSLLTGSIENAFIVGDFIFPPIIFVLLYFIVKNFIKNTVFALLVAFITVIARDLIAVIPFAQTTLSYVSAPPGQFFSLFLSRAFHPQFTFIILAAGLLAAIRTIEFPNKKSYWAALGILSGLLFYSYVFYWTYFLTFLALLFLYFLHKKDKAVLKGIVTSLTIAAIIGLHYFLNMYEFARLEIIEDFTNKSSLAGLSIPLTTLRYFLIAAAFIILVPKTNKHWILFMFLTAGLLIAPFSRFILDKDLETLHYLRRAAMPFATISFFIIIYQFTKNNKLLVKTLSLLIFLTAILVAFNSQIRAQEKPIETYKLHNGQREIFSWLNSKTQKGEVVGSLDIAFNLSLPVYTHNKVYFPRSDRTIMPTSEQTERYVILSNVLGISSDEQKAKLNNTDLLSYMFAYQAYSEGTGLDLKSLPRVITEQKIDELTPNEWEKKINNYKLDYVVTTPDEIQNIKPYLRYLEPATSVNEFIVFKTKE